MMDKGVMEKEESMEGCLEEREGREWADGGGGLGQNFE